MPAATPSFTGTEVTVPYTESESTSLTMNAAESRVVGEIELAVLWLESTSITPSTPAGWTLLASVAGPGGPYKWWLFARICDGTAADDFATTFSAVPCEAGMRRVTGAAAPADWQIGTSYSATTTEGKVKALTTTDAGDLAIGIFQNYSGVAPTSSTAGWTRDGSVLKVLHKAVEGEESTGEPEVKYSASEHHSSLMIAIPATESPTPQTVVPLLEYGFEDGTLKGFNTAGVGEGPVEPEVSTEVAHRGTHSVVVDMPAGSTQNRAELMLGGDGGTGADPIKFYEGAHYRYSFWHYIFPGEMAYGLPGAHNLITQLKSSGEGSPEAAIGLWNWEYPSGSGIYRKGLWVSGPEGDVYVAPYAEGVWHHPQIEFIASEEEAGMFRLTVDGDVVYELSDINTIIPGHEYLYLKSGNYRNGAKVSTAEKPVFDKGTGGPCHDAFDDFRLEPAISNTRIAINREHPPSRLAVLVKDPDGTPIGRWAEDESKLENVLGGLTKSGDMPGGHTELSCALPRDPNKSYPDLALFSTVELQGAGGERLWTGGIRQEPEDGERQTIEVKAVGDKQFLEDDEAVVGPGFINSDQTAWHPMSSSRRAALLKAGYTVADAGSDTDPIVNLPALRFDIQGDFPKMAVEAWFDAGPGVRVSTILWDRLSLSSLGVGYPGTGFSFYAHFGESDQVPEEASEDLHVLAEDSEVGSGMSPAAARRFAGFLWEFPAANSDAYTYSSFVRNAKVIADHGLVRYGNWPSVGFLAQQMIPLIVEPAGLTTNPDLLEDDGFVIPHAWFDTPGTPMSKLVEVTKYGLLDFFVFNDKILQYRKPGAYGRKWRLSPGSGTPKNAGQDANRVYDRLTVTWQDVDGTTKRAQVGPLTDERNAAVAAGRPRGKLLALNGVCTEELAIRTSTRFLEEAQNLAQSGEATISGHVQDEFGIWYPAAYVQPGDWAADPGTQNYRKITSCNYSRASESASVTLGAPPEQESALEARFNAKLIELGLG